MNALLSSRTGFLRIAARAGALCAAAWGIALAEAVAAPTEEHEEQTDETSEIRGVLLGDFFFRDIRGAEGIKTRLSFSLYASVSEEHEGEFRRLLEKRRHRVREQVITAIRLTATADLQQPSLDRLKRRILMRLRRTSPGLGIGELHFREFTLLFD